MCFLAPKWSFFAAGKGCLQIAIHFSILHLLLMLKKFFFLSPRFSGTSKFGQRTASARLHAPGPVVLKNKKIIFGVKNMFFWKKIGG